MSTCAGSNNSFAADAARFSAMNIPEGLRYSSDHEWVAVEGDIARVGITDYAQDALGDVVYVDLPVAGGAVQAGASFGEVESTKSVSELYAPVSGTIASVNDELVDAPELDSLLDAAAYRALIEG